VLKWNISKSADGSVGRNALFDLSHTAILHLHLYRFELGCDFYFWCFPLSNVAEFPVTCPIYIKCCYCDIVSELWPCCWLMLRQCLNISLTECTNITSVFLKTQGWGNAFHGSMIYISQLRMYF